MSTDFSNLLPNPFADSTDPKMWREELRILRRIRDGQRLVMDRHYVSHHCSYAVSWYWQENGYPRQLDAPVVRLLGRQALRPVQVAGGYTWMALTEQCESLFAAAEESAKGVEPSVGNPR